MSRAELIDRGRQEFAKRTDTLRARLGYDFAGAPLVSAAPLPGKFFFMSDSIDALTTRLRQRLPQHVEDIVRQADKILAHKFDLLGYEDVDVGHPIDWHWDAVHGKRSPRKPFYKIRYLDFEECGDSKVVWELNRHQHLVTLARACRLTGDRRYADEIFSQWTHWHSENPYPYGINWASSLEVAFRSLAWMWMYHLLEGTSAMPAAFAPQWLQSQARNGRHIERYLSTYFSANTHLLGEAVALFFLGVLCPQLTDASRWKARGWQIILEESRHQVQPDGFHFEQSVYYHVYAVDFFLHSLILAARNGIAVPPEFEQTVEKMLDTLLLLGRSGCLPSFGDDDGGRLFDPRRNQRKHLFDPLATGAVLFRRPDFRALAGELKEETLWLLGEQGIAGWENIAPAETPAHSGALLSAGYYVLTTFDPPSSLIIDAGPQGAQSAGHGHADALSVCLHSGGRALLIDPGTAEYVGAGTERERFRGTAAHNTVCVDGTDQSEPAGPFAWTQLTHARAERWIQGESFDLFVGSHDGYGRLESSIVHRRFVVALKNGLFLVRDCIAGRGTHRVDLYWHLGPGLQNSADGPYRFENGSKGLALMALQDSAWTADIRIDDWSPVYGRKEHASVVQLHTTAELPVETATLLIPLPRHAGVPTDWGVFDAEDRGANVQGYHLASSAEDCQFFFADDSKPWRCGKIASDARFVGWQRTDAEDAFVLILCDGSYIEVAGKSVLESTRPVERCELFVRDGAARVSCSDTSAMVAKPELVANFLRR